MKKEIISYEELSRRVGDAVLFNEHAKHNESWWCGIYEQPLMREKLDAIDEENRQYNLERIKTSTDESERAKLQEEYDEDPLFGYDCASVTDFEIYQTYHITRSGAEYLINHTAEIVSYDEELEAFLWHITHWGTSWSGVHTEVYDFSDEEDHEYIHIDQADKYMIG